MVFINNVHELSARILESPIQTHLDTEPTLGGSDPNAKPALRGSDPSTSMMTSPANVVVLALNQTD